MHIWCMSASFLNLLFVLCDAFVWMEVIGIDNHVREVLVEFVTRQILIYLSFVFPSCFSGSSLFAQFPLEQRVEAFHGKRNNSVTKCNKDFFRSLYLMCFDPVLWEDDNLWYNQWVAKRGDGNTGKDKRKREEITTKEKTCREKKRKHQELLKQRVGNKRNKEWTKERNKQTMRKKERLMKIWKKWKRKK